MNLVKEVARIEDIYPLSPMQEGLLSHTLDTPGSGIYVVQSQWIAKGTLWVDAWQRAWQQVIQRHSVLRTCILWDGLHQPLQVVSQQVPLPWSFYDWRNLPEQEQQTRITALLQQDRKRGFDPRAAPLLRLTLVRLGEDAYYFLQSFHHLLLDGWSGMLLLKEVWTFYQGYCQGCETSLSAVRPYRDYIAWLQHQSLTQAEPFWQTYLSGFTTPNLLPGHNKAYNMAMVQAAIQRLECSATLTTSLQKLACELHVTLNTLFQGAWALLLSRYSSKEDILFGATTSGRPSELTGVETMIGVFINTLPVRVRISADDTLSDWLCLLQAQQIETRQYEYMPLARIQACSQVQRGQSLFESLMVFQNYPVDASALEQISDITIHQLPAVEQTHYPLLIKIVPREAALTILLQYDEARFESAMITRMLQQLQVILQSMASEPGQRLGDLPLLTDDECHHLLVEWNATQTDYPQDECVHQIFEQQVLRTPDVVALVLEDEALTYDELNGRANQLAHYLQGLGIGPERLVGICMQRSIEMVVGLLAVLKAGGAYVPLDPSYPDERLAFMAQDAHASVFLTRQRPHRLLSATIQVIAMEEVWERLLCQPDHNPISTVCTNNLAYIIYTSGSTGAPKGVQVTHRGLGNLGLAQAKAFAIGPESRVLQFASLSFDASISEILMALLRGASLHLERAERMLPGPDLWQVLQEQAISAVTLPPSALAVLPTEDLPALKTLVVAGEACPVELMARWAVGRSFFNAYGPTEASVCATVEECSPERANQRSLSLGRPLANTQFYLLDQFLQPVPVGVPGEICLGGIGLARGYMHLPEITAERFVPHPWSQEAGACLYRTGDLARYRFDDSIEFLGRRDQQVKLRGFRIELGEIEAVLSQHPAVRECVVAVREETPVAYVVLREKQQLTMQELHQYAATSLPSYMVPSLSVFLEALPLTPTGKVDRRALQPPEQTSLSNTDTFVAPRSILEEQLVHMWQEMLHVQRVSVNDSFFHLGGESLKAAIFINKLREMFGVIIHVAALFDVQTVAGLADYLTKRHPDVIEQMFGAAVHLHPGKNTISPDKKLPQIERLQREEQTELPAERDSLVAIQVQGSRPPFFCVHPVGGTVVCYAKLAHYLGSDQPFYGLQTPDQSSAEAELATVEQIAAHYLAAIQTVQPQGPYLLGGWSLGGIIALEIAQQLQRQGEEVGLLAVIDSGFSHTQARAKVEERDFGDKVMKELIYSLQIPVPDDFDRRGLDEQLNYAVEQVKKLHNISVQSSIELVNRYYRIIMDNMRASYLYSPQRYERQIDYFAASASMEQRTSLDERENAAEMSMQQAHFHSWHELAQGGMEVHLILGNHRSIVEEPYVQALAKALKRCIDRVCEQLVERAI